MISRGASTRDRSGEFARGWKVVFAAAIGVGTGLAPVPFYTIGVFAAPLSKDFGWTVDQVLFGLAATSLALLVAAPAVGYLTDRFGVRFVALTSTCCFGVSLMLCAVNPGSLPLFYASYALLAITGAGTLPVTWTRLIISSFKEHRGLALGLSLLATGVFGSLAKIWASFLIETSGWRMAYIGLAAFPLLICLPIAFLFFRESKVAAADVAADDLGLSLSDAVKTRHFWIIAAAVFLITFSIAGVIPNLERLIGEKGFDAATAVQLASIIGIAVLVGRPIGGWLLDRFWAPAVGCVILSAPAVSYLLIIDPQVSVLSLAGCVFLIGFASGVEYELVAYLVSRYFGRRAYSAIYGSLYIAFQLAVGFGPYLIGRAFTQEQSYDGILEILSVVLLLSCVMLLTLGRYPTFAADTAKGAAQT